MPHSKNKSINSDKRFWDKAARKYSKSKIGDLEGYEKTIVETKKLVKEGDHVLELGCGTGTTALKLAPLTGSYRATDISTEMIAIANEKFAETLSPSLTFSAQTVETIEPLNGGYDLVLGFNYLNLVPDLDSTLIHVYDLLKTGGLFITKTPCLNEMNFLIRLIIPLMRLIGFAPNNINSFSAQELKDKIRDAGFKIQIIEYHSSKGKDYRPFIVARRG